MKRSFSKDSVIAVTGASSGIGEELALACARQGAAIILIARNAERLDYVARKVTASGGTPLIMPADITDRAALTACADTIEKKYQKIDCLMNVAGLGLIAPITATPEDTARQVIDVNFFGTFNTIQTLLPLLKKSTASVIVNIVSPVGKMGWPGMGIYSAAKAAVRNLSEALSIELHAEGIAVMQAYPGYTKTNFLKNAIQIGTHKDDDTTAGGLLPFAVATRIMKALMNNKKEVTIVSLRERVILTLHHFCKPLADFLLEKMQKPA